MTDQAELTVMPSGLEMPTGVIKSTEGWVTTKQELVDGSFAWIVWNGVVQHQPWQWVDREDEDELSAFFFEGHELGMDEVDAYWPIRCPPPPSAVPSSERAER